MKTRIVMMIAVSLYAAASTAQPVVDNSSGHSVGLGSPNTGVDGSYSPNLALTAGRTYTYTYAPIGGNFVQNFFILTNFNAWTPGGTFTPTSNATPLLFNYYVPPGVALCSSETIHIRFRRRPLMGMEYTVGTFDLKVVIVENGERGNLAVVDGTGTAYYGGADQKAHSMTWNSGWSYAAITPTSGWGSVRMDGHMAAFADGSRIFFKGTDGKLYQLVKNGPWTLSLVLPGLPLVGGRVVARNNNEVVFFGNDGKLHQLLLSGGVWTDSVVVPSAGWGAGGAPDGNSIALPRGSSKIFFVNGVGKVCDVGVANGNWTLEQISPASVPWDYGYTADLLAMEDTAVYYQGADHFIHRYVRSGNTNTWSLDPMQVSTASESNVVLGLNGYLTKFIGDERVFYKASNGAIYNVYKQAGAWYNYPLDPAMSDSGGDLVAAEGKIFHVHHDKRVHNVYWSGNRWYDGPLSTASQADAKGCINVYY